MTPLLAMNKMKMQKADLAWFLGIDRSNVSRWVEVPAKHVLTIQGYLSLSITDRKSELARIELERKRPVRVYRPRKAIKGEGYARV